MKRIKEHVAVALLIAALVIVAFWGIELHLLLLTVIVAAIAYIAFMPAIWEREEHTFTKP